MTGPELDKQIENAGTSEIVDKGPWHAITDGLMEYILEVTRASRIQKELLKNPSLQILRTTNPRTSALPKTHLASPGVRSPVSGDRAGLTPFLESC